MATTVLPGQDRPERILPRPLPITIPGFFSDSDDESLTPLSSSEDVVPFRQTEAEMVRERKLLQDPMVTIISPYLVRCQTCGTTIKLSMKSRFDACHWRTHRSRCLKKQVQSVPAGDKKRRKIKPSKAKARDQAESDILTLSPPNRPRSEERRTSCTPSLEEDTNGNSTPEIQTNPTHRHMPSPLSLVTPSPSPGPKDVFEEYLFRSHGKTSHSVVSTRWQDWSWDQLLVPRFVLDLDFDFVPRLQEDSDDDSSLHENNA